ncbi:CCX1 [Symbiodinium natans]|uniref:CCX1 protein n=1 Tax=Symbiodinium natans TaxID=878477 RepID=A0A812ML16_9DINO|nr:CCX1 [Symbiodinium natans]
MVTLRWPGQCLVIAFISFTFTFDAALAVRPGLKIERGRRLSRIFQSFLEDQTDLARDSDRNAAKDDQWQRPCEQCQGAFMNYFSALQTATRPILVTVGIGMTIVVLTWLMMDTAQLFFLPALFYWSKRLKLSSEMAAATLLALGNGAPDMADAVAAAQLQDLPLGLSDLGGANLCSLSWGNCLCLLVAYMVDPDAKTAVLEHQGHYLVLLAFYGGAIVLLSLSLQQATVNFWHVCALTALYGAFLLYLLARNKIEEQMEGISGPTGRRRNSSTHVAMEDSLACLSPPDADSWRISFAWALLLPFTLVRMATIPPCDLRWDTPRRVFHTMCPTGLYLLCRLLGYIPAPDFNGGVATAVVLILITVTIFITGGTSSSAKMSGSALPWFYSGMSLLALVSSMLWLSALSDEITASLEGLCRFYKISRLRSGFTLLAWGNCAGDLVAAYSISLMGEFSLAFHGLVASQFFNVAVGFSAALMTVTWKSSEKTLFDNGWPVDISHPLLACVGSILIVVAMQAVFSLVDLNVRSPCWSVALAANYGTFFIYMWMNTSAEVPYQLAG